MMHLRSSGKKSNLPLANPVSMAPHSEGFTMTSMCAFNAGLSLLPAAVMVWCGMKRSDAETKKSGIGRGKRGKNLGSQPRPCTDVEPSIEILADGLR